MDDNFKQDAILPEEFTNEMPENWYCGKNYIRPARIEIDTPRFDADISDRQDAGVANLVSGMGTSAGKSIHTFITDPLIFTPMELGFMYHSNGVLRKIIDIYADQMVRKWMTINGDIDDILKNYLTKINAQNSMGNGIRWARLYGGSIIFMGINDGRQADEPVDYDNIKTIEFLRVIDRSQIFIYPIDYYLDAGDPKFGQPAVYTIRPILYGMSVKATTMYRVHESRCLRFDGDVSSDYMKRLNFGWGAPVLQAIYTALLNCCSAYGNAAELMHEMVIKVFYIKELQKLLSTADGRIILQKRFDDTSQTMSTVNGVFLSTDEKFERHPVNSGGIDALITKLELALCAVTGIPYMIFYGKSPSGLSATGDNEMSTWASSVKQKQEQQLRPQIQKLLAYILLAKDCKFSGDINNLNFEFDSLEDFSEKELVAMRKTQSEIDLNYYEQGVLMSEEIRSSRFENGYHFDTELEKSIPENPKNKAEAEIILKQQYERIGVDNTAVAPDVQISNVQSNNANSKDIVTEPKTPISK